MSQNIISPQDIGRIAGDIATSCDSLELETVIRQLEIVLRFARARSQRNTELDQQVVASDNPLQKPSYDNSAASSCSFSAIGDFVYPDGGIALNRNGVIEELYDTILLSQEIVPEDISGYPSDRVTVAPLGFGIPEQRDHETQFAEDDLSTYLM